MPRGAQGPYYRAIGCRLHDDCFTCPFPDCVYPIGGNSLTKLQATIFWKGWLKNEIKRHNRTLEQYPAPTGVR